MKLNMGSFDRGFRLLIALIIGILFFTNIITGTLGIILLVLAGVFLFTSVLGFCPLYALFGLNTCPRLKH
jgi:hypothetical protein